MAQELGSNPKLWLSNTVSMVGLSTGTVQKYVADGLVTQLMLAEVQRGRHIFNKQSFVQLLLAKSLVESGMNRDAISRFMRWLEDARAAVWTYPNAPTGHERLGGDPDEDHQFHYWDDMKFDPLPPLDSGNTSWMEGQGYPRLPLSERDWPKYWAGIKQLIAVEQHEDNRATVDMVLLPSSMAHSNARHASYVRKWCSRIFGVTAMEPLVLGSKSEVSTIRFVDLAPLKRKVAEVILDPPEDVRISVGEADTLDIAAANFAMAAASMRMIGR